MRHPALIPTKLQLPSSTVTAVTALPRPVDFFCGPPFRRSVSSAVHRASVFRPAFFIAVFWAVLIGSFPCVPAVFCPPATVALFPASFVSASFFRLLGRFAAFSASLLRPFGRRRAFFGVAFSALLAFLVAVCSSTLLRFQCVSAVLRQLFSRADDDFRVMPLLATVGSTRTRL